MKKWLTGCIEAHPACRRNLAGEILETGIEPLLPKRVIDVGPNDGSELLRLLETDGKRSNFVALSHRWGSPEKIPLRTTIESLPSHLKRLDPTQMSRTYLDAIAVTRAVGERYLWIDSLCIIQDDTQDWEIEAEHMGNVYEDALFTIAASTKFAGSDDGLFFDFEIDYPKVDIPYFNSNGKEEGIFTVLGRSRDLMQTPVSSALSKRGWATQEWILSRRMVHYMDDTFLWACSGMQKSAQNHVGVAMALDEFVGGAWQDIIEKYTARQFTHEKDRLAALLGLANRFKATMRDDRYHYGMWQEDLIQELAWERAEDGMARNVSLPHVPSWSWASRVGHIKSVKGPSNPGERASNLGEWEPVCVLLKVDDCGTLQLQGRIRLLKECGFLKFGRSNQDQSVGPVASDQFDQFRTGPRSWELGLRPGGFQFLFPLSLKDVYRLESDSGVVIGCVILDFPYEPLAEYYFVLLARKVNSGWTDLKPKGAPESDGRLCKVLVVVQHSLSRSGVYERVGMATLSDHLLPSIWRDCTQEFCLR